MASPEGTENLLREGCNLIVNTKTHLPWRRMEDNELFVVDNDPFKEGLLRVDDAKNQARESINSNTGCSTCPLKDRCKPTPEVLVSLDNHFQVAIYAAVKTHFE